MVAAGRAASEVTPWAWRSSRFAGGPELRPTAQGQGGLLAAWQMPWHSWEQVQGAGATGEHNQCGGNHLSSAEKSWGKAEVLADPPAAKRLLVLGPGDWAGRAPLPAPHLQICRKSYELDNLLRGARRELQFFVSNPDPDGLLFWRALSRAVISYLKPESRAPFGTADGSLTLLPVNSALGMTPSVRDRRASHDGVSHFNVSCEEVFHLLL
nr:uncharacterized protein LOC106044585 isoform X1 [Anser cygnoides]